MLESPACTLSSVSVAEYFVEHHGWSLGELTVFKLCLRGVKKFRNLIVNAPKICLKFRLLFDVDVHGDNNLLK